MFFHGFKDLLLAFIGICGLRLDRSAAQISITFFLIAFSYLAVISGIRDRGAVLVYTTVIWLLYYIGHILFYRLKFPNLMIQKFGKRHGYRIYEVILGVLFFHQANCQAMLIEHYLNTLPLEGFLIHSAAAILFFAGFVVKLWATVLLRLDGYYWRDIFLFERLHQAPVIKGPYKYFKNPMYGIGNLTAYGGALWYGSIEGTICAAIYQASIYAFYFWIEKPHFQNLYAKKNPKGG